MRGGLTAVSQSVWFDVYSDNIKRCGRCRIVRRDEDFHASTRSGLQSWCKECRKTYDRAYHLSTREVRIRQKREWKSARTEWARSLKAGRPCSDCGRTFPPVVMQWDHRPGTQKLFEISEAAGRLSRAAILAEIGKCDLVCANCHAVRTEARRHGT